MSSEPAPTPADIPPLPVFPKILRILYVSAILMVAALVVGNIFFAKDFGTTNGPLTSESGSPESFWSTVSPSQSPLPSPTPTPIPTAIPEIRVTLTAVGDIIMHSAVTDGGLTNPGEDVPVYDFDPSFQYVSSIFEASDLAIANYEGTLNGPPYTGFPSFCGPDAIADAMYTAGFRVVGTANNHCIDKGFYGVVRTATVLRDKGFTVIGTRPDIVSPMDTIVDLDGIKIGLLNYTFETPGSTQRKSINGIPMPEGADPLINSFNPYREAAYEEDLKAMLIRVDELRLQGADLICMVLHWGNEYTTRSVKWQRDMAQELSDGGVDLIIGHHPHVLEEIDVLTSTVTGKQTLVYYSLGNFLGNWAYVTNGTAGKAQDGMIARITIVKNADGVTIEKGEYIPTFVVRLPKGSELQHLIVPVIPAISDPDAYQTTVEAMQASYKRTNKILGECTGTPEIPVLEAAY
jgi:poly-gamma-glutamate capsule biosynthesis protein CapA/YwtB (metallophosphatase superfamily)